MATKKVTQTKKPIDFTSIKSVNDALKMAGKKMADILLFPKPKNDVEDWHNRLEILCFVRKQMVGDFKADWSNRNQLKWYPWMEFSKSTSGFSFWDSDCGNAGTASGVGSRLCFPTEEMSDHFGKTFDKEINDLLTNIPE